MNKERLNSDGLDRRVFLVSLGSSVLLTGCLGPGDDDGNDTEGGNDSMDGEATMSLQTQLDAVRSATEKYSDPRTAGQDGYRLGGPYVPGMGWHFTNPDLLQQSAQNGPSLETPPILTYLDNQDTEGLQLAAVEYAVPVSAVSEPPDLFDDSGAVATEEWHSHGAATHVFALPDDERTQSGDLAFEDLATKDYWAEFAPPDQELSPGDTVSLNWGSAQGKEGETTGRVADLVTNHPDLHTLHAWVHTENPDGVFSPVHPDYTGGHSH